MDVNSVLNIVLIACAAIFILAAAFRIGLGLRGRREEEGQSAPSEPEEARQDAGMAEESVPEEEGVVYPRSGYSSTVEAPIRDLPAKELFSRVVEDDPDAIREIAELMLQHSLGKGGLTHIPPHKLKRLAMQFAVLEVAMKRASYVSSRGLHTIPNDLMCEILREGFRLVASQREE